MSPFDAVTPFAAMTGSRCFPGTQIVVAPTDLSNDEGSGVRPGMSVLPYEFRSTSTPRGSEGAFVEELPEPQATDPPEERGAAVA